MHTIELNPISVIVWIIASFATILCGIYNYNWVRMAYSKLGRYKHKDANILDMIGTFVPFLNCIVFLILILFLPPVEKQRRCKFNRIFRIKNKC